MRRLLYTILFSCIVFSTFSQRTSYFRRVFVDAEYYLLYEDFKEALPLYLELHGAFPDNANFAYRIGLCYLNIPNEKHKAIPFFEQAKQSVTNSYKEGYFTETQVPKEIYLHYGTALRIANDFEKAIAAFEKYRGLIIDDEKENKQKVSLELKAIAYAKELMESPISVKFTSAGKNINGRFAEINPVVSADNRTMVYTAAQQFYNAILISTKRADVWTNPININSQMFADGEIATVGLSADGTKLLLSRNDNDIYNLYTSVLDTVKNTWGILTKLPKEINTRSWENYGTFSPTGDTIYYSSNQPGGMGGFDIYMSVKTADGWTIGANLGASVNTPLDEIAPTLSHDGKKLFFSSLGHQTMGGYDIFVSELRNSKWSKPKNMGYPLNTTDDDVFFYPIGNGSTGYISRSMLQSQGDNDIYLVEFANNPENQNGSTQKANGKGDTTLSIDKSNQLKTSSQKPIPLVIR
ncbi:MAG: hypothetical protein PHD06_04110 [Bacteroidales bacterium]|jgi:tetratricopeptide (TPR) repeat protein|nr:hypothetical protein [Bacteroidales bacterium]MDD4384343.1 hypothetical protein [Bacteroidales bacterium]MDY0198145.1 hypothetical protein [Tenuifilaceae bacterium]